ncbi:MAG: hypothetical protein II897_06285 [Clostridia bacterium]|nr:hypothetical protein [Clostridia bacterium]
MKDKKLMHMRRADLIEIIYQLQQSEEALRGEVAALKAQLEDRRIRIERSGSVAEAALSLSGIFEAAQRAADLYMEEIGARAGEEAPPEFPEGVSFAEEPASPEEPSEAEPGWAAWEAPEEPAAGAGEESDEGRD